MLRAGLAPVGYRGPRVGSTCAGRHVASLINVPARARQLQPRGPPPPRGPHFVPAPQLALRARRKSLAGAPALADSHLSNCARLEQSLEHNDLFYLVPPDSCTRRGSGGPRSFFLDADRTATTQLLSWLSLVRSKWRGVTSENEKNTAVSMMAIIGTPKTGKTLLLNVVLPALIADDELFGVGCEAEARIFRLSTEAYDCIRGVTGFLCSLLGDLLLQAYELGIAEVQHVRQDFPSSERSDAGAVVACLESFVDSLPHNVPHFIMVDNVQNFFRLFERESVATLDRPAIDQMRRIFTSLVGSSPIHCTWVVTGWGMATFWGNLALDPVPGFSILDHVHSIQLPTRVDDSVLERARAVLRQEFSSTPPEPVLQFSAAYTVAEVVFYAKQWERLEFMHVRSKTSRPPIDFCLEMLAVRVYPEMVCDLWAGLSEMDVASRQLVVQLVNSEIGVEESKLPRGLLSYFRPYMRPTAHGSKLVYVDSPMAYAALAVLVDVEGQVASQIDACDLVVDFVRLERFCAFGDMLSGFASNRRAGSDYFENTPREMQELLRAWCKLLKPSFWKSTDADHWFNVTLLDPFHETARDQLNASSYDEPWQYLHLYLRLWRNSVEHKKKESVAASFAHMRTLPRTMAYYGYEQLEEVMAKHKSSRIQAPQ